MINLRNYSKRLINFGDYIKNLKKFLKWCRSKGYPVGKKYRKFYRPRKQQRAKALRESELLSLYDLLPKLSGAPLLERDLIIFLFIVSSAMRRSDYGQYNPEKHIETMKIDEGEVRYINLGAIKNEQECIVPFIDDLYFRPAFLTELMLKKYGSVPKVRDWTAFNKNLKEIFQLAGITRFSEDEIGTKIGRKTWSTIKDKLGMSRDSIKKVTGHRDDKSLNHYIGIDPEDVLRGALSTSVKMKIA